MSQHTMKPAVYYGDTKAQAAFDPAGPHPRFLLDSDPLKVLVAGLEPGQEIPIHPEAAAMYHFLAGSGTMWIDGTAFAIQPGATVIAPGGADRGMTAATRLVFLAAKVA